MSVIRPISCGSILHIRRQLNFKSAGDFVVDFMERERDLNSSPNTELGYDMNASKLRSMCMELAQNSYKCLADHDGDRSQCNEVFAMYKQCRKTEHEAVVNERRRKSGGGGV